MTFAFGLLLAPFIALVLISFARWVSNPLRRMPDNWLKRLLFISWTV